ncbi:hypothetical protein F6V25_07995 [Oryzomonas japonica]|uniref:Phage protein n=1 Tax=Oryzomonas japonica TaxID=2603858 RepID=A0A7J4ZR43_9BACT|nr:hypothetical protein [Oryzomonas japonica]KAB0665654.1 hypothetical protein F6V25_07995 [Oryzomonas japonica]
MGLETATIIAIAATVASAGGAAYSAYSQSEAADEQAKLQEEQAAQEKAAAEAEAAKIREKGQRTAAAQEAALAGSGVKLDANGSGGALLAETDKLTEQDALAALTTGNNRAKLLEGEAAISRDKATSSLISGGFNVGSSLIGGYNSYQKSKSNTNLANSLNADTFYQRKAPKYTLLGG